MHDSMKTTIGPFDEPMVTPKVQIVRPDFPHVQWSSGREQVTQNGKMLQQFVGARVEVGIDPMFDAIAKDLTWKTISIKHLRANAPSELHDHWVLPTNDQGGVVLFPFVRGTEVRNFAQLYQIREEANKWGIRVEWRKTQGLDGKERPRSHIQFLVFHEELVNAGYDKPLIVMASGHLTDHFVAAIADHVGLVQRWQADMPEAPLFPVHVGMVLGPGEPTSVGKGMSTVIVPPKLLVPRKPHKLPAMAPEIMAQRWTEWTNYLTALRSLSEETN